MKTSNLYQNAHLFVSAIRIMEYKNGAPPSVEEICEIISCSREQGHFFTKKLNDLGIIELVAGTIGTRLFIRDHLKIEDIPKEDTGSSLQAELEKFKSSRKAMEQKVEWIQEERAKRQQELFSKVQGKFREKLEKQNPKKQS